MNTHPYFRAYMAGITIPTMLLLIMMTVFILCRHVYNVPIPIERVIVFPMAIVPNLWGSWNMLYVLLHSRRYHHLPIGFHGALLTFIVVPLAFTVTRAVDFPIPTFVATAFPFVFPVMVVVFYLVWKHLVGFCNQLLGIA